MKIEIDISNKECIRHFITQFGISSRDDLMLTFSFRLKGCFWTVPLLDKKFIQIITLEH
jgi:hypothetical protein